MGEVHHGNTVTDYLEQERKRGKIINLSVLLEFLEQGVFVPHISLADF